MELTPFTTSCNTPDQNNGKPFNLLAIIDAEIEKDALSFTSEDDDKPSIRKSPLDVAYTGLAGNIRVSRKLSEVNDLALFILERERIANHPTEYLCSSNISLKQKCFEILILNPAISIADFFYNATSAAISITTILVGIAVSPLFIFASDKFIAGYFDFMTLSISLLAGFVFQSAVSLIRAVPLVGLFTAKAIKISEYALLNVIQHTFCSTKATSQAQVVESESSKDASR